ncbi:MAG: GGDEF domain-containing protein [Terriglobales bacterium]
MSTAATQNYNYGPDDFLSRAKRLCARFRLARQRSVIATRPAGIEFAICRIDLFEDERSATTPLVMDYEWLQFHDEYMSIDHLLNRFALLHDRKFSVNTLQVPLQILGFHDVFLPSANGYSEWPGTLFEITLASQVQLGYEPLLHIDHPSYKSPYDALGSFVELPDFGGHSDGRIGHAVFFVPVTTARIVDVRLTGLTLAFQFDTRKRPLESKVKIAYSIGKRTAATSVDVRSSTAEVRLDFVPDELAIWLLSSDGILDSYAEAQNGPPGRLKVLPRKLVKNPAIPQFGVPSGISFPFATNEMSRGEERDDLLPVLRRKAFDSQIKDAFEAAQRDEKPLSLLMVDLDNFKKVNDEHGHRVGDEVLVECAEIINSAIEHKGEVYRYGGEEIIVVLPNFSPLEATAVAERVRSTVAAQKMGSQKLPVTVSVGVSSFPAHANSLDELLRQADQAMYKAKKLGRDLVCVTGDEEPTRPSHVVRRKAPSGGALDAELIRALYFSGREPKCPADGVPLRISETRRSGNRTPDLNVSCPLCGLHEYLKAPL